MAQVTTVEPENSHHSLSPGASPGPGQDTSTAALVGERLTLEAFAQLSGNLAGYPFVKVVVERPSGTIHFINNGRYQFHADYISERFLKITLKELESRLDDFNHDFYLSADRKLFLGILALHRRGDKRFFTLESVEIDNMDESMCREFLSTVKENLEGAIPLLFTPANHDQESFVATMSPAEFPRVFTHELFASAKFIALNPGNAVGRLRAFRSELEYRRSFNSIEWYDIVVMPRVPDDIPRVAGIINSHHTTPLSHTNVLASGWQIPNAIQLGVFSDIEARSLDGQWVSYSVDINADGISLAPVDRPIEISHRPAWSVQQIRLEEPETVNTPIVELDRLKMGDRYKYGTKAANLGELRNLLDRGSQRLIGFYRVPRAPRPNLLSHLSKFLGVPETADLNRASWEFLQKNIRVPKGIAIPFSVQQEFLESSPRIQQAIGKLKMALELGAREIDPLCVNLQQMIRNTRMPESIKNAIDTQIANHLSGVSSFVVRSSSNAEDLENFSAAGIYESLNHVTTAENIFQSIKEVWASLVSPRSVRLRQQVGISLDDCYMGVIVQEECPSEMGGVLVTTNPTNRSKDFRNVYINVSPKVEDVVQGSALPLQYLFNTVEGGGRTLSIGDSRSDLVSEQKAVLQRLAYAGRLLQSHFSPDYTFSSPVDIEWIAGSDGISIVQLRPYSK